MDINECSPFLRAALIQPLMYCGKKFRRAFDCRLIYITAGNGKVIFQNSEYDVCEGSVIYIPVAYPYRFSGSVSDYILNFDFTRSFSSKREGRSPVETPISEQKIFDRTIIDGFECPIILSNAFPLGKLFQSAVDEHTVCRKYSEAKCSVKTKEILIELLCLSEKKSKSDVVCENTLSYIKMNCTKISSNNDIGKALGYNSIYLNSILKEKFGKSIHRIIIEEKVFYACQLLTETDMTLEEIAYAAGFSSRNYFCTVFKSITNYPPSEYRNR